MADPTLRALFAARLMQARQLRALSQRALGDRMGLGKQRGSSRINRYEHQVTAIGFDNLAPIIWHKIANATFEAVQVTTGEENDYYIEISGDYLTEGMEVRSSADSEEATVNQSTDSANSESSGLGLLGGLTGGGGGGDMPSGGGNGGGPGGNGGGPMGG